MIIKTQSGELANFAHIARVKIERGEYKDGRPAFSLRAFFTQVQSSFSATEVTLATYDTPAKTEALRDLIFAEIRNGARAFDVRAWENPPASEK